MPNSSLQTSRAQGFVVGDNSRRCQLSIIKHNGVLVITLVAAYIAIVGTTLVAADFSVIKCVGSENTRRCRLRDYSVLVLRMVIALVAADFAIVTH